MVTTLPSLTSQQGVRRGSRAPRGVRLPDVGDVQQVSPRVAADPGLSVPRGAFGGGEGLIAAGGMLGEISNDLWAKVKADQQSRDKLAYAKAKSDLQTAKISLDSEFERDPDWETMPQRYEERLLEAQENIAARLSGDTREFFLADVQPDVARGLAGVRGKAWAREVDVGKRGLDEAEEDFLAKVTATKDPAERVRLIESYHETVDGAQERGYIDEVGADKRKREAATKYVRAATLEWFRAQPNSVAAAEALFNGQLPDPGLQKQYEMLPPDERAKLFSSLVQDVSRLQTLRNSQRSENERVEKENADAAVKDFWLNRDLSHEERFSRFDQLRTNPHVSPEMLKGMEEFLREGGRAGGFDDQADLFQLEAAIRSGTVKDEAGLIQYRVENGLEVSVETMRSRLVPMIEARQDETFRDVLNWGQSELGIISGSILGDFFKDPVNKAAQFEAELRRFRRDNPSGDVWGHAEKIVERLKKQGNAGALSAVPTLAQSYRQALAGGDPEAIANAKSALTAVLVDGGKVDPLAAASEDFNPLAIIDEPKTP